MAEAGTTATRPSSPTPPMADYHSSGEKRRGLVVLGLLIMGVVGVCVAEFEDTASFGFTYFDKLVNQNTSTFTKKKKNTRSVSTLHPEEAEDAVSPDWSSTLVIRNTTTFCDIVQQSYLYSPTCQNTGQGIPRRLLVTGMGRSGTSFLAYFLRKHVQWLVSHDNGKVKVREAPDGAVSWPHAFKPVGPPNKQCRLPRFAWKDPRHFAHVLHWVRNPLLSMRSRWNKGRWAKREEKVAFAHCVTEQGIYPKSPTNSTYNTLNEVLQHWVLWNTFIESYAEARFRLEDLSGDMVHQIYNLSSHDDPQLAAIKVKQFSPLKKTQQEIDDLLKKPSPEQNSNHTHKPDFDFTWDMMADANREYALQAQLMALRYGYEVDPRVKRLLAQQRLVQVCGLNDRRQWGCSLRQPNGLLPNLKGVERQ